MSDEKVRLDQPPPQKARTVAAEFATAFRQFWAGYFKGPRGC